MANKSKYNLEKIGHYAFIIGIIAAILVGAFLKDISYETVIIIFGVFGIIVGLLNITAKETKEFLISSLVILVAGSVTELSLSNVPKIGFHLSRIWHAIIIFTAFAATIVAIKTIYALAEKK